jgi:hypothetical protein
VFDILQEKNPAMNSRGTPKETEKKKRKKTSGTPKKKGKKKKNC